MRGPREWLVRYRRAVLALGLAVWSVSAGSAQDKKATISGRVVSAERGTPIPGVRVTLLNQRKSAKTDSIGRFAFGSLKPGTYHIEVALIGFMPLAAAVAVGENERKEIEFRTDSAGVLLPTIFVEGESQPDLIRVLTKFDRRMAIGVGRFITREQILQRNPMRLMDLIRMLPGVRTQCNGISCQVKLNHDPRGCGPAIYVDEVRTSMAVLETTAPTDVQGIEVFRGPAETPPELNNETARCGGAISIWTRRGGAP